MPLNIGLYPFAVESVAPRFERAVEPPRDWLCHNFTTTFWMHKAGLLDIASAASGSDRVDGIVAEAGPIRCATIKASFRAFSGPD